MPKNFEELIKKICKDQKVAFIIDEDYIPYVQCTIVKIPKPVMTGWHGIPLRGKSPYRNIFNRM